MLLGFNVQSILHKRIDPCMRANAIARNRIANLRNTDSIPGKDDICPVHE